MAHQTNSHSLTIPIGLVRLERANPPVISVYADWRVSGRGRHEASTVVEKHLREALASLPARGEAHQSVSADTAAILTFLQEQADPAARSIVVFASRGRGLWFVQESVVPIETFVHVGDLPRLLPFAEMVQDAEEALVAIVDSEHLRLVDLRLAAVRELEGLDADTWGSTRISSRAAWRTANRLRARETILERFADEAAAAIVRAVEATGPRHLAIAGGDEITALVRSRLPDALQNQVTLVGHASLDLPEEDVVERIWPQLTSLGAQRRSETIADLLRAHDCVSGSGPVHTLLEMKRVGTLAFDADALSADDGEALLRQALDQRADVLIARGARDLAASGGVAALPR